MEQAETKSFTEDHVLSTLLFLGKMDVTWHELGTPVTYDLFPTGIEQSIARQVSGLDLVSREQVREVLEVANALVSVGGYHFKTFEEKLKFVHGLQLPVFSLFRQKLMEARTKQQKQVQNYLEQMGKSQPNHSSEPAGDS